MALPSQNARPISRRAHMHRRRRPRRTRSLGFGVVVVVLLLAAWWVVATMLDEGDAGGAELVTGVGAVVDPTKDPVTGPGSPGVEEHSRDIRRTPAGEPKSGATRSPKPTPKKATPPTPAATSNLTESPRSSAPEKKQAAAPPRDRLREAINTPTPGTGPGTGPGTSAAEPRPEPTENRPADSSTSSSRTARRVAAGLDLLARDEPIQGRRLLSEAMDAGDLSERDAAMVRERLAKLNQRLVFSPEVVEGDPFSLDYIVKSGDLLSRIPRRMGLLVDWRFIQLVNRIDDPKRVRAGQRLKLVTGPFHAVVDKSDYRLDLYLGDGPDRVYVRSFPVGLGEFNSTPEGRFRVRENSKLIDPEWINPRTRQRYAASDPANPIGEYWIGLDPDDEKLAGVEGYGLHGTIEPDSIGRQASMGCVRMLPDDIEVIWGVMTDGISTITIVR